MLPISITNITPISREFDDCALNYIPVGPEGYISVPPPTNLEPYLECDSFSFSSCPTSATGLQGFVR